MIADVDGRVLPVAPLVLDDAGSLEAMAGAVMRLHSTLLTIGRCYTDRVENVGVRVTP